MATVTEIPLPNVELIESDGEPLETLWHLAAISLLMDSIHFHLRDRTNYFVGGNMFFYFSQTQARNRDYRGPDFFYVDEVDGRRRRDYWAVWDEDGRYPDVIVELLSPSTAVVDRTVKKELYERTFRTPEYFCYDPATETFEGWRLGRHGRYEAIVADERGWLRCERFELWMGMWTGWHKGVQGVFPRFYDPQGRLVFTPVEGEAQRAEAAEAENARLKAQVAELKRHSSAG